MIVHVKQMMEKDILLDMLVLWWVSGTTAFKYQISLLDAIIAKAQIYGFLKIEYQTDLVVSGSSYTENITISGCIEYPGINIVFISVDSGEEYMTVEGNKGDRKSIDAWHKGNFRRWGFSYLWS